MSKNGKPAVKPEGRADKRPATPSNVPDFQNVDDGDIQPVNTNLRPNAQTDFPREQVEKADRGAGKGDRSEPTPDEETTEDELDKGLEDSFPASDPFSPSSAGRAGGPKDHRRSNKNDG
jgi:hypothetical protein